MAPLCHNVFNPLIRATIQSNYVIRYEVRNSSSTRLHLAPHRWDRSFQATTRIEAPSAEGEGERSTGASQPEQDYLPSSSFSPTALGLEDPKTPRYLIAECFGSGGFPCSYYQSAAACLSLNHPTDFTVVWAQNANEGMRVGTGTCQAGTNDSNKIVDVTDININQNSKTYAMFCCSGSQFVDPGVVTPPE